MIAVTGREMTPSAEKNCCAGESVGARLWQKAESTQLILVDPPIQCQNRAWKPMIAVTASNANCLRSALAYLIFSPYGSAALGREHRVMKPRQRTHILW